MNRNILDSLMQAVGTYHKLIAFVLILFGMVLIWRWWTSRNDTATKKKTPMWKGILLLGLGLADFAFMPGFLNYYFTTWCNRLDHYRTQKEEMTDLAAKIKDDIASYKNDLKTDESDYQKLIFDLYWSYRKNFIPLENAKSEIENNVNTDFLSIMIVKNNIKKDIDLANAGNDWLTHNEEFIKLLTKQIEQCERDAQKNVPIIRIDPVISSYSKKLSDDYSNYLNHKKQNVRQNIIERDMSQIEVVEKNGVHYDKAQYESVLNDLAKLYERYSINLDYSKLETLIKLLEKLESISESGGDNFDLGLIRGKLKNVHTAVNNLIQQNQYPLVLLELRDAFITDTDDANGIITLVQKLSRTTKQRKDLLETCENLRLQITEYYATPFMVKFDSELQEAINQIRGLNYASVEDPVFWQNLLDELQGIKNSVEFMDCSEFTSKYRERSKLVSEKLKSSAGYNKKLEVYLKRFETQLKEASEESWAALQHYNESDRLLQEERYDEAIEEINKALEIDDNEDYQKKKKDIEDVINANKHYEAAVKYNQSSDYTNALEAIDKALVLIPNDKLFLDFKEDVERRIKAEDLYKSAQELENNIKYQEAIDLMEQAVELYPSDNRYSNFIAQLQTELKVQADIEMAEMYYTRAKEFAEKKNFPQASAAIAEARKIAEEKKLVEYDRKYLNFEQEINDLIELENNRLEIEKRIVNINKYLTQKDYDNAFTAIQESAFKFPAEQKFIDFKEKLAEELYESAQNYLKLKNYEKAYKAIEKSMQLFPDRLKYVQLEQNVNEALENIRIEEEKKKRSIEIEKQLANIDKLINNTEYRAANNALKENLSIYPSEQKFIDKKVEFDKLLDKQKEQYAENCYKRAVEFQKNEKLIEAIDEIDKALLLYPESERYNNLQSKIKMIMYKLEPGKNAGDRRVLVLNGVEFPVRWCPPTTSTGYNSTSFLMGTDSLHAEYDERPAHYVTLTSGFWIMETELTNKQWHAIMKAKTKITEVKDPLWYLGDVTYESAVVTYEKIEEESDDDAERNRYNRNNRMKNLEDEENLPKNEISWSDCRLFCDKVRSFGIEASLPTEAQWEYACKAGSNELQDDINELAWTRENSYGSIHPVAQKKPNAWGIYDMHGNVAEWCKDYHGEYKYTSAVDPSGPTNGDRRVIRGGSFIKNSTYCRSTIRYHANQTDREESVGARFVFGKHEYIYNGSDKKVTSVTKADASKPKPSAQTSVQTSRQTSNQPSGQTYPSDGIIESDGPGPIMQKVLDYGRSYIPGGIPIPRRW